MDGVIEDEDDNEALVEKAGKDLSDIGSELAERIAGFFSDFNQVEASGPVAFDYDSFKDKLEHFLDLLSNVRT